VQLLLQLQHLLLLSRPQRLLLFPLQSWLHLLQLSRPQMLYHLPHVHLYQLWSLQRHQQQPYLRQLLQRHQQQPYLRQLLLIDHVYFGTLNHRLEQVAQPLVLGYLYLDLSQAQAQAL
jgi:hypothetical protein